MITPNSNQNILNFSASRFINELSILYQIDSLNSIMSSLVSKFISTESLMIAFNETGFLSNFGRHLAPAVTYVSHTGTLKGYSQPALIEHLALTKSADIESDNLSSVLSAISQYTTITTASKQDFNSHFAVLSPHNYIYHNYQNLTLPDISKLTVSSSLEDIAPSDASLFNTVYTYEILLSAYSSILKFNIFNSTNGVDPNATFTSVDNYITSRMVDPTTGFNRTHIISDISNLFSFNSQFYSNLVSIITSGVGIHNPSKKFTSSITIDTNNAFKAYFISGPSNLIDHISLYFERILVSIISKYSTYLSTMLAHNTLQTLSPDLEKINQNENVFIRDMYNYYLDNLAPTVLSIEAAVSGISEDALDSVNLRTHLYSSFINSLDGVADSFDSSIILPSVIPTNIDVADTILSSLNSTSFASSDPAVSKIMNSIISQAITYEFESYIVQQQSSSSYFTGVIQPIISSIQSNSTISTSLSPGELSNTITSAIVASFNFSVISDLNNSLPNTVAAVKSDLNYSSPITPTVDLAMMSSLISNIYSYRSFSNSSKTITRLSVASTITTIMNSFLDTFSV